MADATEILKVLSAMPGSVLVAAVLVAGFGLAAFAIYAVLQVSKGR